MIESKIIEYIVQKYTEGKNVKVHFTKIDYDPEYKYCTSCGVYIDGELDKIFEFEHICNREIDEYMAEIRKEIQKNTVYLMV